MKLTNYKSKFLQELSPIYDEMETASFFYLIMEHLHQLKRIDLALNPETEISESDVEKWSAILSALKIEKPINAAGLEKYS